jgi:hypothetical protein
MFFPLTAEVVVVIHLQARLYVNKKVENTQKINFCLHNEQLAITFQPHASGICRMKMRACARTGGETGESEAGER